MKTTHVALRLARICEDRLIREASDRHDNLLIEHAAIAKLALLHYAERTEELDDVEAVA